MSWNGFSRGLAKKLISLFTPASTSKHPNTQNMSVENNSNLPKIWIPLPYIGKHGLKLTNSFIRRITPLLKLEYKIIINWQTTDAGFFVSLKDPTPINNTKAPLFMNLNAQDAMQTTLEKPTVAYTQDLKNAPRKPLQKYIIT